MKQQIAAGEFKFNASKQAGTILPGAGDPGVSIAFDPISGVGACATASPADIPDTATYRTAAVPAGGYTLMGSPTVVADITSPSFLLLCAGKALTCGMWMATAIWTMCSPGVP